jgi:hypothetical protein
MQIARSNPIVPIQSRVDPSRGRDAAAFRPISAPEMQAHQQNAQTTSTSVQRKGWGLSLQSSTAPRALGSKEQIDLLKAKIDNVRFTASEGLTTHNPLSQPPPSGMQTVGAYLKFYGKGLLRTLETVTVLPLLVDKGARSDLKAVMGMMKDGWDSMLSNSDAVVGNKYIREGQTLVSRADQLDQQAAVTSPSVEFGMRRDLLDSIQMRDTLTVKPNRSPEDEARLTRLIQKVGLLESHLGRVDDLRQEAASLRKQGESAVALGVQVRGEHSEMAAKYLGYPALVAGSLGKTAFTTVQAGTGLAKGGGLEVSLEVGAQALGVSRHALQAIGIAGAGVSAAIDAYDFFQTSRAHNKALNKVEMAEALLTDHPGRLALAAKLEGEASRLEQGGITGSMIRLGARLNPFADRSSPEILRNKAIAIRGIDPKLSPENLDPAVKAVVTQIKEHADIQTKRIAMVKNVVGIVGAGLAIAALTVACPPAGLVVAACAIGVCAGGAGLYMSYCNWFTSSQRFTNVTDLRQSLGQIDLKESLITEELSALRSQPEAQNPASEVAQKITFLEGEKQQLQGLRMQTTLNLLAASPDDAAVEIYKKAKAGDRQMHFLARSVLGVAYENLPESVAVDAFARGMHLDVNK